MRFPAEDQCRVFRSTDAGDTWEALTTGLPARPVLRRRACAMRCAPTIRRTAGIYFGTRTGEVFASRDEGESWTRVAASLPDVLCVRAASL